MALQKPAYTDPDTAPIVPVSNANGDVLFLRPDVAEGVEATLRAFRQRTREETATDGRPDPDDEPQPAPPG